MAEREYEMENMSIPTINLNEVAQSLPYILSSTNFWMLRAEKGAYYTDFFINQYIGIGYNEISVEYIKQHTEEDIKNRLIQLFTTTSRESEETKENSAETVENADNITLEDDQIPSRKAASWASQLSKFVHNIKKNDVVLVPNENSESFAAYRVTSDAYDEDQEKVNDTSDDYKHSGFSKRIKVSLIKTFSRKSADSAIFPLIYSHHTLTDANNYREYIKRAIFDTYIENDKMHLTFQITDDNNISARNINQFISSIIQVVDVAENDLPSTEFSNNQTDDVDLKINVQSPGPAELIMHAQVGLTVISILIIGFQAMFGGNLNIGKGKYSLTWKTKGLLKSLDEHHNTKVINKEKEYQEHIKTIDSAFELYKKTAIPMSKLGIDFPEEATKAVNDNITIMENDSTDSSSQGTQEEKTVESDNED